MISMNKKSLFLSCLVLISSQFTAVQSSALSTDQSWTNQNFERIFGDVVTNTTSVLQSPVTKALCTLQTDELIKYYGYIAEKHYVVTEDGYNLTVFRCNSNKTSSGRKKAVILQHGILSSSDDVCINIPSQGLAYVMADEGYDVFIPNARGNFYSRNHITLSPNDRQFWNFSWYEIGVYDYPAVYNYVIKLTGNEKVFVVGHSQGTSATMAVLSEKPEVNDLVHAVSLMAPIGYMNNTAIFYRFIEKFQKPLETVLRDTEFLPRGIMSDVSGSICGLGLESFCDDLLSALFGQSKEQKNDTMYAAMICHVPSGASIDQLIHYSTEIRYGYFGKYKIGSEIPSDFDLSEIKAPISIHYSTYDSFTDQNDINRLIPQLKSRVFVQKINETKFNHMDFVWGKNAAKIVYQPILNFFKEINISKS